MKAYRVEDGEELAAGVKDPSIGVPLDEGGDDEELDHSEETRARGHREPRRVLLQHGRLEHQPPGPRQAVTDEEEAAQRPVLPLGITQPQHCGRGGRRGRFVQRARRAEYGGTFVQRDDRRAADAG
ncbi:hypothetical protein GW17_00059936 [Ensete ventricosum]|nr:hypothetical protein GW17_00059936 [Ensete ventricosum]